jgi:hypothetical protein
LNDCTLTSLNFLQLVPPRVPPKRPETKIAVIGVEVEPKQEAAGWERLLHARRHQVDGARFDELPSAPLWSCEWIECVRHAVP